MTQHTKEHTPRHAANSPEEATIKVEYNKNYIPRHALIEEDSDIQNYNSDIQDIHHQ